MPRLDLLRTLAFMNLTNTKKTKWMERKTPICRVCLVLIISVFASLPMFILSFCEVSRGILKKIEYYRSRFFWQNDRHKKKYRLVKWNTLRQPEEQGGLEIQDLDIQNKCLLNKSLYKLCNEEGLWQELLRNKYLKNRTFNQTSKKAGD